MRAFIFILACAFVVYIYHWLVTLEREIRSEVGSEEPDGSSDFVGEKKGATEQSLLDPLSQRIISLVAASPGLLQKEVYGQLADLDRSKIQKRLQQMAATGELLRVRAGSSYKLYRID